MPNKEFTLEDYINQESEKSTEISIHNPTAILAQDVRLNLKPITSSLGLNNIKNEQEFENLIIEHISSPKTIKDVSEIVGAPLTNESEDQFVKRSIENISNYLLNKFG